MTMKMTIEFYGLESPIIKWRLGKVAVRQIVTLDVWTSEIISTFLNFPYPTCNADDEEAYRKFKIEDSNGNLLCETKWDYYEREGNVEKPRSVFLFHCDKDFITELQEYETVRYSEKYDVYGVKIEGR